LNPKWEEKFGVTISNGSILKIKVYDYDRFSLDDLCGETQFNLNNLRDGYVHDIWLDLTPQVFNSLLLFFFFFFLHS